MTEKWEKKLEQTILKDRYTNHQWKSLRFIINKEIYGKPQYISTGIAKMKKIENISEEVE